MGLIHANSFAATHARYPDVYIGDSAYREASHDGAGRFDSHGQLLLYQYSQTLDVYDHVADRPADATFVFGFAMRSVTGSPCVDGLPLAHLNFRRNRYDTGDVGVFVEVGADGSVTLNRCGYATTDNPVLLASSAAGVIDPAAGWHHFELKVQLGDAGGYLELRVDGTAVATFTGQTLQDTAYAPGEFSLDNVTVGPWNEDLSQETHVDDLWLLDDVDTGDGLTDFLGPDAYVQDTGAADQVVVAPAGYADDIQVGGALVEALRIDATVPARRLGGVLVEALRIEAQSGGDPDPDPDPGPGRGRRMRMRGLGRRRGDVAAGASFQGF